METAAIFDYAAEMITKWLAVFYFKLFPASSLDLIGWLVRSCYGNLVSSIPV